jgi:uncharacterized integral membrane protein
MRFIGRFLWLIISLTGIVLAMLFAVSNTQVTMLRLWPFESQLDIAVWGLALGAFVLGALFGGGLVWLSLVAARTRNWKLRRALGKAEKRAALAEDQLAATETGASPAAGDVRRLQ